MRLRRGISLNQFQYKHLLVNSASGCELGVVLLLERKKHQYQIILYIYNFCFILNDSVMLFSNGKSLAIYRSNEWI